MSFVHIGDKPSMNGLRKKVFFANSISSLQVVENSLLVFIKISRETKIQALTRMAKILTKVGPHKF